MPKIRIVLKTSRDRSKSAPGVQDSKIAKGLPRVNLTVLENRKSNKMDREARRGPLARAPGALKGGHFRIEGGPFGEKTNFRKKSLTMPKN